MCKLLPANRKLLLCQRVVTCACCRAPRDRDQERTKLLSLAHVRANVTSGPLAVVCVASAHPRRLRRQSAFEYSSSGSGRLCPIVLWGLFIVSVVTWMWTQWCCRHDMQLHPMQQPGKL